MDWHCDTSLLITDDNHQTVFSSDTDKVWESSSTIKVPIILLTLHKMQDNNISPQDTLKRMPHQNSSGSGVLNWTKKDAFTFNELLTYTLIYSDCLAANMLIDYIGGRMTINTWLEEQGYSTRLSMEYLIFSDNEEKMPQVGVTTAQDMLAIYRNLEDRHWRDDYRKLINVSMSNVHNSWFELSLGQIDGIFEMKHKTGSMIDIGPDGETVYNAVGSFIKNSRKYYFCLLSHGLLNKGTEVTPEHMKTYVTQFFKNNLPTT